MLEVEKILEAAMGLDSASIGSASIERAVVQRMQARKLRTVDEYVQAIRVSEAELLELIETVTVPETWFFRDKEAFTALCALVRDEWRPAHPDGTLQILSVPCSTGEEPYSIAMALLDCGLPAAQFRVLGVDISARVLEKARQGIYGKNSFRSREEGWRQRHFAEIGDGVQIARAVRSQVIFQTGNLVSADFLPGACLFDFVFCRNLLIYFGRQTQARALQALKRLLTEKGLLFVGPAETGLLLEHSFVSARIPLAFAFRKQNPAPPLPENARIPRIAVANPPRTTAPHSPKTRVTPVRGVGATSLPKPAGKAKNGDSKLDLIGRLANQGKLDEAARLCETELQQSGPSADLFFLFGLVRGASGMDGEAATCYRKALYLKPDHYEALVHLALLAKKLGDRDEARVLDERVRRVRAKKEKSGAA